MSKSGMQPERSKPSNPAAPAPGKPSHTPARAKRLDGDPAGGMTAMLLWNSGSVTVAFGAQDFYADETGQTWTWNSTARPEAASTHSDTFNSSNASGNSLTVVQNRPSGNVTFAATGIARGTSSVVLVQQ